MLKLLKFVMLVFYNTYLLLINKSHLLYYFSILHNIKIVFLVLKN